MKRSATWWSAGLYLLAGAAWAQTGLEASAAHGEEHLTGGRAPWTSDALRLQWRPTSDGARYYGGWRTTRRFGLDDEELQLGSDLPLGRIARLQIEFGHSPTGRVLAENSVGLRLDAPLSTGLVGAAGWRRASFAAGLANLGHLGLERYLGSQRFGYTLYAGGPDGAATETSHRLHWAWHYAAGDERNWLGVAAASGHETEHAGTTGFVTSAVSGLQISGVHWFARDWAVDWEAGRMRQGGLYTRTGWQLGLRHAF